MVDEEFVTLLVEVSFRRGDHGLRFDPDGLKDQIA
jgi:hypothetical protein